MYELEDISENVDDGFIWYSAINQMECFRVQVMKSSHSDEHKIVLHIYDQDDNIQNMEEYEQLIKQIEG